MSTRNSRGYSDGRCESTHKYTFTRFSTRRRSSSALRALPVAGEHNFIICAQSLGHCAPGACARLRRARLEGFRSVRLLPRLCKRRGGAAESLIPSTTLRGGDTDGKRKTEIRKESIDPHNAISGLVLYWQHFVTPRTTSRKAAIPYTVRRH